MELLKNGVIFLISFFLIIVGGDKFVDAAICIGRKLGISTLVLGATIVSLTTTLPELFVSSFASAGGHVDMAIGNAIGSIICNTGLILGLCAVLSPMKLSGPPQTKKAILLIAAVSLIFIMSCLGPIRWYEGLILYALLGLFIYINFQEAKDDDVEQDESGYSSGTLILFFASALAIVLGSRLLVNSASALAALMHVPEKIIALSLVALGTSLPELVTSLTAIRKHEAGLSIGNIIGANILNIVLVMSTSSLLAKGGLTTAVATEGILKGLNQLKVLDIPIAMAMALILFFCTKRKQVTRATGILLLCIYVGYLSFIYFASVI